MFYIRPSLIPTLLASTWTWVSTLDILGSFHLGFYRLQLYNHISFALGHDVQVAFRFPLDN
jgi:hypothetical protein